MPDDIVSRARAALEGVTPGPWEPIYHQHDTSYPSDTWNVITELTGDLVAEVDDESRGYEEPHGVFGRDAQFVAAARGLVPELVAEVERLRGMVGWLVSELATEDVGQGGDPKIWFELAETHHELGARLFPIGGEA